MTIQELLLKLQKPKDESSSTLSAKEIWSAIGNRDYSEIPGGDVSKWIEDNPYLNI